MATCLNLPASALVGSSLAVSCASLMKLTHDIPVVLRNIGFSIVGLSLGSGMTKEALEQASHWPVSLLILLISVCLVITACGFVLVRFFGNSLQTGILASSPGALGHILALTAEGNGEPQAIVIIQTIRIFMLTTMLPLVLGYSGLHMVEAAGVPENLSFTEFLVLLVIALGCGWLLIKKKIPAACFLAGIMASGIGHVTGVVTGRPAPEMIFIGFTITGSIIGARFSSIPMGDFKRLFLSAVVVFLVSSSISVLAALLVARLTEVPFGQIMVAFAPGGVEAMAAMALSLGFDPTYVAVHHLFRIFMLIGLTSILFKARFFRRFR